MVKLLILLGTLQLVTSWRIKIPDDEELPRLNDVDDESNNGINIIFPGTKWCGSGSVASQYNDLGRFNLTDACCREHDLCPDLIESGGTLHGLTNNAPYTRLSCECDTKFLKCLRKTSRQQRASKFVGVIYFDGLQTQCYQYDHPIVKCTKRAGKRCLQYDLDTGANKTWQWFDVPFF